MEKVIIGEVTHEETVEIQSYHLRRKSLLELQIIVTEQDDPLYKKIEDDLRKTISAYTDWWDRMKLKYSWCYPEGKVLTIDFETSKISYK